MIEVKGKKWKNKNTDFSIGSFVDSESKDRFLRILE